MFTSLRHPFQPLADSMNKPCLGLQICAAIALAIPPALMIYAFLITADAALRAQMIVRGFIWAVADIAVILVLRTVCLALTRHGSKAGTARRRAAAATQLSGA